LRCVSRHIADLKSPDSEAQKKQQPRAAPSADQTKPCIAVLFDYNGKFRRDYVDGYKEKDISWIKAKTQRPDIIIIALGNNITPDCVDNYRNLVNSLRHPATDSETRNKTFVVVRVKTLQAAGVVISDDMPMENIVTDINIYFGDGKILSKNNSKGGRELLDKLKQLGEHLIIILDNAALYIMHGKDEHASIQIMPNFRRPKKGDMPNEVGIYVAAIARHLYENQSESCDSEKIENSIRLALLAHSYSYETGIASDRDDKDPAKTWSPFRALDKILIENRLAKDKDLRKVIDNLEDKYDRYRFSSIEFPLKAEVKAGKSVWKRTKQYAGEWKNGANKDGSVFHRIVWLGVNLAGRDDKRKVLAPKFPLATIACPYAAFGKLKLIDSDEIEEYSSCSRIIGGYLQNENWQKPLCIAVFGRPGTGKSFAVRQLVSRYRSGGDDDTLVFNLAQFDSLDQLTECFHSIQSAILSSRHPPLVMFDEFDSEFGTPLGWLKYFLAPMQDGEFRGKTNNYKIGRAIFAFAGGTSRSFEDFQSSLPEKGNNDSVGEITRELVKVPDFVSRLHGYLNVRDLGKIDVKSSNHHVVLLRRAIILRTLLEEHKGSIFLTADQGDRKRANIDKDVIDHFLEIPAYPFGVRSMEAIIRASTPIDNRLVLASLPPESQTSHHKGKGSRTTGGNAGTEN
jgi:hypothetical protein